jgi:hypothetical protein
MVGRIYFLKTVLNSSPLYYMSIFVMPKSVVQAIIFIQRRFLWAGTFNTKKICKVSWNLMVREKNRGWLRVGSLIGKTKLC